MYVPVSAHTNAHAPRVINAAQGVPCITVRGRLLSDNRRVGKSQTDRLQSGAVNGRANERDRRPSQPAAVYRRGLLL